MAAGQQAPSPSGDFLKKHILNSVYRINVPSKSRSSAQRELQPSCSAGLLCFSIHRTSSITAEIFSLQESPKSHISLLGTYSRLKWHQSINTTTSVEHNAALCSVWLLFQHWSAAMSMVRQWEVHISSAQFNYIQPGSDQLHVVFAFDLTPLLSVVTPSLHSCQQFTSKTNRLSCQQCHQPTFIYTALYNREC